MSATGEAGFTLLEMLVVIAIATLIAGLGFPRLQGQIGAQEWRTATASATALLRDARARALRGGRVTTVAVAADGTALRLDGDALVLPHTVRVTASGPLAFHADGSASGGDIAITSGARVARLGVAADTGLVSVRTP